MRIMDFNAAEDRIYVLGHGVEAYMKFETVDADAHIYNLIESEIIENNLGPAERVDFTVMTFIGVPLTEAEVMSRLTLEVIPGGSG